MSKRPHFAPRQRKKKPLTLVKREYKEDGNTKRQPRPMGYKNLEDSLRKSDEELLYILLDSNKGFIQLIEQKDISKDLTSLALKAAARAASCSFHKQGALEFLGKLMTSKFFLNLPTFLNVLSLSESNTLCQQSREDILNIIELTKTVFERLPTNGLEILSLVTNLKQIIEMFTKAGVNVYELVEKFNDLEIISSDFKVKMTAKIKKDKQFTFSSKYTVLDEPPDDYRSLSTIPTKEELVTKEKPFLRPNIIEGSYPNNMQYLDTQFRLLREDFISPLRAGIQNYLGKEITAKRIMEIKIYENVKILNKLKDNFDKIIFALEFNSKAFKNICWESSRRLMYGSLLCLSHDDFNTVLFATVENRDIKNLRKGFLYVHLINPNIPEIFEHTFIAVESTVYYEAYHHILESLKEFPIDSIPFERYIVKCDVKENLIPPDYLKVINHYDINNYKFPILDTNQWPTYEQLHLDESQYLALQMALTKKFAIIQGPPGCGKTFIGLKVVEIILNNKTNNSLGPILVVCYTNHALDQFLEGILNFGNRNIVRIGGRSCSEMLDEFNLNNKRKTHNREKIFSRAWFQISREMSEQYIEYGVAIKMISKYVETVSRNIISENELYNSKVLDFDEYCELQREKTLGLSGMLLWLTQLSMGANSEYEVPDNDETSTNEFLEYLSELYAEELHDSKNPIVENELDNLENCGNQNSEVSEDDEKERNKLLDIDERFLEESDRLIDIDEYEGAFENTEKCEMSTGAENDEKMIWVETDEMKKNGKKQTSNTWILNLKPKKLLKGVLIKLHSENALTEEEVCRIKSKSLWKLTLKERRQLYLYWLAKYRAYLREKLSLIELKYKENVKKRKEIKNTEDCDVLQQVDVIGMTTTGAAKYRELLKQICPKIIIIEEAAEVLEAHILTTLSNNCEHLILIGDHKQLRPKPNSFELATKFNMNISLFERMIMNGMSHVTLHRQHRMRPEIASLMSYFYKDLENHESVLNYANIDGINSNIFFIQHEYYEQEKLTSHANLHEARFIKALCKYLLQQNYLKEQITIITPYTGQLLLFKQLMPKDLYEGIRICCLDNFQGEENDIILLSLVRSNSNKKIGFLKNENRVCVALSRAKKGFYCIGNFEMFAEISEMWAVIINNLKASKIFGRNLSLKCFNHQTSAHVSSDEDFITFVPEGGCAKPCDFRLNCGHVCEKPCHIYDVNHEEYKCLKQCLKTCNSGHPCQRLCFMECLHCPVIVEKIIATCGHSQRVQCFEENNTKYQCQELCDLILSCGHKCQKRCDKTDEQDLHICSVFCKVPVKKYLNCGHSIKAGCSENVESIKCCHKVEKKLNCGHLMSSLCSLDSQEIKCEHRCQTLLDCRHPCLGICADCHQGRVHKPCGYDCKRILICSHECTFPCTNICPPCRRGCENRCSHSRCFNVCGIRCPPCKEPCTWRCKHYKCAKLCFEFCDRPPCNEPCPKKLKCRHQCIGLCGEPCPSLCRICDKAQVTEIFFGNEDDKDAQFIQLEDCNHIIEVNGLDQWMNLKSAENDNVAIQLKTCPKCKTPIRSNLYYGNIIKKVLQEIEEVKCKMLNEMHNLVAVRERILDFSIECPNAYSAYSNNFRTLNKIHFESFVNNKSDLFNLCIIENQIKFTKAILDVEQKCNFLGKRKAKRRLNIHGQKWESIKIKPASEMYILLLIFPDKSGQNILEIVSGRIKQEVEWMKSWALKFDQSLAEQPIREFSREVERLQYLLRFYEYIINASELDILASNELKTLLKNIQTHITKPKWLTTDSEEMIKFMNELEHLLPLTVRLIPKEERIMIVKAIGLKSGHWYKCPKGHPYAIGDCGGASEISKCPECKSKIGGTNHNLLQSNALAPEMDGASYPAWSEEANMRDFEDNIA